MRTILASSAIVLLTAVTFGAGPVPAPTLPPPPTVQPGLGQAFFGDGSPPGFNGTQRFFPSAGYFQHVGTLYNGDYKAALDGFKLDYSLGLQAAGTHWVDSICYLTMAGECRLKMGRLADALDDYDAALKLYLAFPNWMTGVRFPAVIRPLPNVRKTPWGQSGRTAKSGRFPLTTALFADTVLLDPIPAPNGGSSIVAAGTPIQVSVQEIARCTALALKRRHELMGPLCANDPLTAALTALFSRRPATDHPCAQAWIDAELGMSYLGTGQTAQATKFLQRAAAIGDEWDHPLTPLVLAELGQLALESGDYKSASNMLEEASYSAFDYGDFDVLDEAFRSGQQVWIATHLSNPIVFPTLGPAATWAKAHARETYALLTLLLAENDLLLNQPERASTALSDAAAALSRHDMGACDLGARSHYLSAMLEFHQGRMAVGDRAMADALAFEKTGSKWLFQIHLIDRYTQSLLRSPISRKQAMPLFESLLRDPNSADWASDPLEAIAVLANLDSVAFEHWFEAAQQTDVELSLEVADRLRRRRFFSSLPFGGRLLAVRWLLESPADSLSRDSQLERQELLTRYPKYAALAEQARALRAELTAVPLTAVGADAQHVQADKLSELGRLSAEQETALREIALKRENVEMLFPPLRKMKEIQAALEPRQFIWIFFATRDSTYAWLVSRNRCAAWKIEPSPSLLEQKTANFLRAIGNVEVSRELPRSLLADESWRGAARDAFEALTAGSKVNFRAKIDELIIVPDGVLWYLPFEALDTSENKLLATPPTMATTLLSKSRIRYLPTMGMAIPHREERRGLGEIAVVPVSSRSRDNAEAIDADVDHFAKIGRHVATLKRPLPAASPVYGSLFDSLVVLDDLFLGDTGSAGDKASAGGERSPYDWSPIPMDRARGAGSLAQWLALPRKGAAQVLLPNVHTPAENGLRQAASAPRGSELFLSLCGLMSTGARTVLISRWRTGGASSEELVHQFAQELPYTNAADAWQRGVQMQWEAPLDLDREPRVKRSPGTDGATARHPLFWSGYMLIDTGWSPSKPEQLAAAKN